MGVGGVVAVKVGSSMEVPIIVAVEFDFRGDVGGDNGIVLMAGWVVIHIPLRTKTPGTPTSGLPEMMLPPNRYGQPSHTRITPSSRFRFGSQSRSRLRLDWGSLSKAETFSRSGSGWGSWAWSVTGSISGIWYSESLYGPKHPGLQPLDYLL